MIIVGFPSMNKSKIAKGIDNFVYLPAREFYDIPNWEMVYCKVAMRLHSQGNEVMITSHEKVVEAIFELVSVHNKICNNGLEIKVAVAHPMPDPETKVRWLKKLSQFINNEEETIESRHDYDFAYEHFIDTAERLYYDTRFDKRFLMYPEDDDLETIERLQVTLFYTI